MYKGRMTVVTSLPAGKEDAGKPFYLLHWRTISRPPPLPPPPPRQSCPPLRSFHHITALAPQIYHAGSQGRLGLWIHLPCPSRYHRLRPPAISVRNPAEAKIIVQGVRARKSRDPGKYLRDRNPKNIPILISEVPFQSTCTYHGRNAFE